MTHFIVLCSRNRQMNPSVYPWLPTLYSHSQTLTWHLHTSVKQYLKVYVTKTPTFLSQGSPSHHQANAWSKHVYWVPPFSLIQPSLGVLHLQDILRTQPYSSITTVWNKPSPPPHTHIFLSERLHDYPADVLPSLLLCSLLTIQETHSKSKHHMLLPRPRLSSDSH